MNIIILQDWNNHPLLSHLSSEKKGKKKTILLIIEFYTVSGVQFFLFFVIISKSNTLIKKRVVCSFDLRRDMWEKDCGVYLMFQWERVVDLQVWGKTSSLKLVFQVEKGTYLSPNNLILRFKRVLIHIEH